MKNLGCLVFVLMFFLPSSNSWIMSFDRFLVWLPPIICFVAIWSLLSFFMWSAWQALRQGTVHLKRLHGIPCDRCVFFTGDFRLKCTVRPLEAMTEEALECRDFEPISRPVPRPVPKTACGACSKCNSIASSRENTPSKSQRALTVDVLTSVGDSHARRS
ncbi:MAG: hypothetical protein SWY16_12835 [Cyanobacteriota bacterium]|nr:hypothetical protein [Cyanobacteriota bacterium]